MTRIFIYPTIFLIVFVLSCGDDNADKRGVLSSTAKESTWNHVQEIFSENCVSCHAPETDEQLQSDLILTPDVAYTQLANRAPKNAAARDNGLLLVGTEGVKSLSTSFLWEKINAPNQDHFLQDHPEYGSLMPPPPSLSLTYGELEFIRKWIAEGAPAVGHVADLSLLENEERFEYDHDTFSPLALPTWGRQLHLGPFEVSANSEREFFYYEPLNNAEAVYIDRVEISMAAGSHHFILYGFEEETPENALPENNVVRDLRDATGQPILKNYLAMRYHKFVTGTQWPRMDYSMPAGVALKLPAHYAFDLNTHYVNRSSQSSTGEVYVNLHYADPDEIKHAAQIIDFNHTDISLPPGQTTTLVREFTITQNIEVFQLFSHAHELNTEFRVEVIGGELDGEEIYFSNDWEHPPISEYAPPLSIKRGQGFRLIATYDNTRNYEVNFGLLSTDEMMILFGLYYSE